MADRVKVPEGYSCVRIVYSGGTVVVVEMIEKSSNIHYTGKIVQCLTQNDIDQFNKEAGRLRTFDHPRIIKLKEVITMDNIKVMVMELGGKSLSEIMNDYTERKILMPREVLEDVASALELMHHHSSGRTAHGDIKMANILVGSDGHAKLCDFGAAESEDVTAASSAMSHLSVSPERMESGEATCEADVWALGVMLYWLLFGEPPFKAKKMLQLIQEISSFKPTSIRNTCGEDERALLMRMMDPCAESRITCRQLRLSKSFQCIVNTIDGVWKLKNDEQAQRVEAEETTRKTEEEKVLAEEKQKRAETERTRMEEERKKAEEKTRKVEEEKRKAETERRKMEEEKRRAEWKLKTIEEQKGLIEREKEELSNEVKRTLQELGDAREAKEKSERETQSLKIRHDDLKRQLSNFPAYVGTESLKLLDSTVHQIQDTSLTQIVKLDKITDWRTAFTCPIDEGDWELKIRGLDTLWNVSVFFSLLIFSVIGFIKAPLPDNPTLKSCGSYYSGIGGDFILRNGGMWKGREFKPPGTNKKCDRVGQTAAIRVNMSTREARLFVDDSEQPGIFTDIPSSLCLGISTHELNSPIEVLHLTRVDVLSFMDKAKQDALTNPARIKQLEEEIKKAETERRKMEEERKKTEEKTRKAEEGKRIAEEIRKKTENEKGKLSNELKRALQELGETREAKEKSERETQSLKEQNNGLKLQLADLQIWSGTESLKTFDRTVHGLTPTTLTQIVKLEKDDECRTAFTFPIDEGEWELKIRGQDTSWPVLLGFLKHPLPEDATQFSCGYHSGGIGGDFILWTGGMWQGGEFKPAGTNKRCDRAGQTAAIRVNMSTREARLFVDDSEQPGIFTDIPSPLCLGISSHEQYSPIEVHHLSRADIFRTKQESNTLIVSARIKTLEEAKKKAETERARMEEEKKKAESERAKMEEAMKKAESERAKMEEEKKKAETERARMEEATRRADETARRAEEGKQLAEEKLEKAEEEKRKSDIEKEKLSNELNRTLQELGEARDEKEKSEREKRAMTEKMERMVMPTEWIGTDSLTTFDRSAHKLAPTTLKQIVQLEPNKWRTAFTFPIDEGEWELKIRGNDTSWFVTLGFLKYPLPRNATQHQCGSWKSGIGGDFVLYSGGVWKAGKELKPEGTNKKCDRIGQTAAIRVNMSTREARLFVDDSEQPGIFPDIPSPLCLAISTGSLVENVPVDILHLARSDNLTEQGMDGLSRSNRIKVLEKEKLTAKMKLEQMRMMLRTEWVGTESLKTIDRTAHKLTPNSITQIIKQKTGEWRTAFTFPVDEGEWELKIRGNDTVWNVMLGFLHHPLPEKATQKQCGTYFDGIGGDFILWTGGMWKGREFKPAGTNKKCDRVGQTATIRVNMSIREARLFVDDSEQPGIFTDIPSPLCLGISTFERKKPIQILHLARTDLPTESLAV
ncbi:putative Serine/threonine-protein kinase, active site [Blattamonas nauphoetae]|uniref:non-specific serine/threonine protein kinase n=1 Tax=Blattamonas nauphoetae TaxID=2049346 RepID=A0ABQ9XDP2_9EUKA|nr:putative Serine/threonine-protein kinase, active site [Blattamonas nauphoetae]